MAEHRHLWVIDPGLMEAGGHHAALAETLMSAVARAPGWRVGMVSSCHIDKRLLQKLTRQQIECLPNFQTPFYKHFNDGVVGGIQAIAPYVRKLASEYQASIEQLLNASSSVVLLFPCVNWEHAWALSMALEQTSHQALDQFSIIVFAMFQPKAAEAKRPNSSVGYSLGFRLLSQFENVHVYASDFETAEQLSWLLGKTISKHPCYLLDWEAVNLDKKNVKPSHQPQIMLYLGDAKEDKGFNKLPELTEYYLAQTQADIHIQYTLAWSYPEIQAAIQWLDDKSGQEPRIKLHKGFWTNEELVTALQGVDEVVCSYQSQAYEYKSSGLLWLLGFLRTPIKVTDSSWLSREAKRLGIMTANSEIEHKREAVITWSPNASTEYTNELYCSLFGWLDAQLKRIEA